MKLQQWLPPRYFIASAITSVGGLLNGLDTGVIGPVTVMPSFTTTFGEISSSLHGLVVSCVLLSATFTSLFSGILSDSLGRTRALAIGATVFGVGAVIEATASRLGILILGRLVVGAGEGLFLSTLVVYICEISPAKSRGPLASMVQLFITIGLMVGFFMCYGTVKDSTTFSWRFPLALQAGSAFALSLLALYYLPESPRWLNHRGHSDKAESAWDKLEVATADRGLDSVRDLEHHEQQIHASLLNRLHAYYSNGVLSLRRVMGPASRRQAFLAIFLMSMQQLSGIDGVLYYAPLLFQQAGLSSSEASFLASGVSAILIFATSIPAFLLTDKIGRRLSTLVGEVVLSVIMATIGSLYASGSVHQTFGPGRWVVIVSIYLFSIAYCMTWALGIKVYASEIQPVPTRATVTSLAQSANCLTNFFVALITPVLLAKSSFGLYFLFCGCTIVTVAVCALFMPETRGRQLESISEVFLNNRNVLNGFQRRRLLSVL